MIGTLSLVRELHPWFFPGIAFALGACIGSFLNVVIYRVPAGKSIVYPGSTCGCGQPIAWSARRRYCPAFRKICRKMIAARRGR